MVYVEYDVERYLCACLELTQVLFVPMPIIHIFAEQSGAAQRDAKVYSCPVYKKPNRTDLNYITTLFLRTTTTPDHWVRRGVAILCDTK